MSGSFSDFRCNLGVWFSEFTGSDVKLTRPSCGNQECWVLYNSGSCANPVNYLGYFDIFLPIKGSCGLPDGLVAGKTYQENSNCSESHLWGDCHLCSFRVPESYCVLQTMKMKYKLQYNSSKLLQRKSLELFPALCLRVAICFRGVLGKKSLSPEERN